MARVFVPCTDELPDRAGQRGEALVPYHPDLPCWRLDPEPPAPTRPTGGSGSSDRREDRSANLAFQSAGAFPASR